MDCIRDYPSTVLHLPVLLPCFAVFPVRFFVSRLVIAHTDAIRAKFYWRKRITLFSKNTFNPICSSKENFFMLSWFQIPISKPRRSLFLNQLAHPTGAYSGSLRMKRLGELHCKVTPLPTPLPRYHPTSLPISRYPFIHLSEERHHERFVFCSRTQHSDPARLWTRTSQPGVQRTIAQNA